MEFFEILSSLFPTRYRIKIVILHSGCNVHRDIKVETLPHSETIKIGDEEKTYNVKIEDLWRIKVRFYRRILYFLMGTKGPFLCIFRSSEEGEAIKQTDIKATPGLIMKVKKSRVLTKALKEMFKENMGGSMRFVIVIGVTLLIVYLAYQSGMIG